MRYTQLENNKFIVEFDTEDEKNNFIKYYNNTTTLSSGEVEKLGISRQLLRYHVNKGDVRTIANGRQRRYLLEDVERLKK